MIHDQSQNAENHSRQLEQEITENKWAEQNLQKRLHFEQLLSDLSARFINIAPDQIDQEIQDAGADTQIFPGGSVWPRPGFSAR